MIPKEITAGDSVSWTESLPGYASPDWEAKIALSDGNGILTVTASAGDDGDHDFTVSGSSTANLAAGPWSWALMVNQGSDRITLERGELTLLPNPDQVFDDRSQTERTLAAVQAMLEGKASKDQMMVSQNGRSLQRHTFDELIKLESHLKSRLAIEQRRLRAKAGKSSAVRVMFTTQ